MVTQSVPSTVAYAPRTVVAMRTPLLLVRVEVVTVPLVGRVKSTRAKLVRVRPPSCRFTVVPGVWLTRTSS